MIIETETKSLKDHYLKVSSFDGITIYPLDCYGSAPGNLTISMKPEEAIALAVQLISQSAKYGQQIDAKIKRSLRSMQKKYGG